jgi:hypothetical protein
MSYIYLLKPQGNPLEGDFFTNADSWASKPIILSKQWNYLSCTPLLRCTLALEILDVFALIQSFISYVNICLNRKSP